MSKVKKYFENRRSTKEQERKTAFNETVTKLGSAPEEKVLMKSIVNNIKSLDEFLNQEVHNIIDPSQSEIVQSGFNKLRLKYFKEALAKCESKQALADLLKEKKYKLTHKSVLDTKYKQEYDEQMKLFNPGTVATVSEMEPTYTKGGELFESIQNKLFNLFFKEFNKKLEDIKEEDKKEYDQLKTEFDNVLNISDLINEIKLDELKKVFEYRVKKRWDNYYQAELEIKKMEQEIRDKRQRNEKADTSREETFIKNRKKRQNTEIGVFQSLRDWEAPHIKDQWSWWDWIGIGCLIGLLVGWSCGVGFGATQSVAIPFLVAFIVLLIVWFIYKIVHRTSKGDFGAFRSFFFAMLLFSIMFCMTIGFSQTNVGDTGIYTILVFDIALGALSLLAWSCIILKLNGKVFDTQEMYIREFKPAARNELEKLHSEIVKKLSEGKHFEEGKGLTNLYNKVAFWRATQWKPDVENEMEKMKIRAAQICLQDMGHTSSDVEDVVLEDDNRIYTITVSGRDPVRIDMNTYEDTHYYYAIKNINYIATRKFPKIVSKPVAAEPVSDELHKLLNLQNYVNKENVDEYIDILDGDENSEDSIKHVLNQHEKLTGHSREKDELYQKLVSFIIQRETFEIYKEFMNQDMTNSENIAKVKTKIDNLLVQVINRRDQIGIPKGLIVDEQFKDALGKFFDKRTT
jgi:hypothetical protein